MVKYHWQVGIKSIGADFDCAYFDKEKDADKEFKMLLKNVRKGVLFEWEYDDEVSFINPKNVYKVTISRFENRKK